MGTVNVLEAARVHKLHRVVVSSSNVLSHYIAGGEGKGDPGKEEAFRAPSPSMPRPSRRSRISASTTRAGAASISRPCATGAVAGPWSGRGGGGPSNAFRDAVVKALGGAEAVVPSGAMEWVYSKDAARGTVLALQAPNHQDRVFNITMGEVTTPDAFAAALRAAVPGARVKIADPRARACRSWTCATSATSPSPRRDGLSAAIRHRGGGADMVAWYRSNERGRPAH